MKKFGTMVNIGLTIAMIAVLILPFAQIAQAAAISSASDIMSSLKVSTLSNHEIKFVSPTGAAVSQTVTVTFPSGFAMGTFALLNFDVATATSCGAAFTERTVAATAGVGTWGAAQAAQVVTLTAPTDVVHLAATNCLRIRIGNNAVTGGAGANQITNPSAAGSNGITIAGTFTDTGTITVQIITDDQVAVSSTVAQTLTFSLGANTLALGTLSSTAVVSGSHTFTVATNAAGGMVTTVAGATLTAGSNTITACAANCTSTTNSEQFGINLVANTAPSVGAAVSGTAPIGAAATNYNTANSFRFVTGETIANSTAGINSSVFTVSYITNISGATEAGSYTATLTYTATATF